MGSNATAVHREPWIEGKIAGQQAPFKHSSSRTSGHFESASMESRVRELALFNLGIDSKLRGEPRRP